MDGIIDGITKHNITSETFDDYLKKLKITLDEAYSAGEQNQEFVAMMKIGESRALFAHVEAIWALMNQNK